MMGVVVKSMGRNCYIVVEATWMYDDESDPLAVHLVLQPPFEDEVMWTLSRQLLMDGLHSGIPVGYGEVKFRHQSPDILLMCLRNETGHADIKFKRAEVEAFLAETAEVVPVGDECLEPNLDEVLDEILAET